MDNYIYNEETGKEEKVKFDEVDINREYLIKLRFDQQAILLLEQTYAELISYNKPYNVRNLKLLGLDEMTARQLMYMYEICSGKISVETKEEIIKHFKKLTNGATKVGIQSLAVSSIKEVPRLAIIGGIKQEPFNQWNSKRYKGLGKFYKVVSVGSKKVTIETKRKPQLKWEQAKEVPKVLKIIELKKSGKIRVEFNRDYCRLCNRFIIVAALKRPEFHHGLYEIIAYEGTKVFVYATTLQATHLIKYNMSSQRVYDFGVVVSDINKKLTQTAIKIYDYLGAVAVYKEDGTQEYHIMVKSDPADEIHDDVET
ncbi:hypothetical protein [Konateibacter massiliensis]|uniref:hypothetical protein n=1 Tax=Konateibacter massiliensis TaxID=2002841 RepID=UPI000C155CAB|nr:hypothetical protein [Konateibacter massiliensis]